MGDNAWLSAVLLLLTALLVFSGSGGTKEIPELLAEGGQRLGEKLTLTCLVKDVDNQSKVTWYKDGQPLREWDGSIIELPPLSRNQDGDYYCCLGNGTRCSVNIKQLRVLRGPLLRVDPPGPIRMEESGRLFLNCVVVDSFPSVPTNNFRWKFHPRSGRPSKAFDSTQSDLTLDPVTRDDTGTYECFARNDGGSSDFSTVGSGRVNISVHVEEASCIRVSRDVIGERGSRLTLTCNVTAHGVRSITWSKDGRDIHHVVGSASIYVIEKVTCADAGRYVCRFSCARNEVTSDTSLQVKCPPTQFDVVNLRDHFTVPVGGEINLSFTVYAYPPPVFRWNRPNLSGNITSNTRLDNLATTTTFRLANVQEADIGVYRLNVSNNLGHIIAVFNVTEQQTKQSTEIGSPATVSTSLWITLVCASAGAYILFLLIYIGFRGIRRIGHRAKDDHSAVDEHHYLGLNRSSPGQEVADYTSGESTGHYWSIDSADLPWQPQAVQPQDSAEEGDVTPLRDSSSLCSEHGKEGSNGDGEDFEGRQIDGGGYESPNCHCDVTPSCDCLCDVTPPRACHRDVTQPEHDHPDVMSPRDSLLGAMMNEGVSVDTEKVEAAWIPIPLCKDSVGKRPSYRGVHCPYCKDSVGKRPSYRGVHCPYCKDSVGKRPSYRGVHCPYCKDSVGKRPSYRGVHCPYCKTLGSSFDDNSDVIKQAADVNVYDIPPKCDVMNSQNDVRESDADCAEVVDDKIYLSPCPYSYWEGSNSSA